MLLSTPLSYFYFDPADKPCTLSPVPLLPASDIGVMSAAYVDALIKAKLEPPHWLRPSGHRHDDTVPRAILTNHLFVLSSFVQLRN